MYFVSYLVLFAAYTKWNEVNVTFLQGDIILLKPSHKDFSVFQTWFDNLQVASDS